MLPLRCSVRSDFCKRGVSVVQFWLERAGPIPLVEGQTPASLQWLTQAGKQAGHGAGSPGFRLRLLPHTGPVGSPLWILAAKLLSFIKAGPSEAMGSLLLWVKSFSGLTEKESFFSGSTVVLSCKVCSNWWCSNRKIIQSVNFTNFQFKSSFWFLPTV